MAKSSAHKQAVATERETLLEHFARATERPMVVLAFVWIGLTIWDLVGTLPHLLGILNTVIWALFIVDFALKFCIAPKKADFLRGHWLTALSLILPAFRILRIFRIFRSLQGISLLRVLSSTNRAMSATNHVLGRSGTGYVIVATLLVMFAGAAGMVHFENSAALAAAGFGDLARQGAGLKDYADGVWWTFMLMTTIGSAYWPLTLEGRLLCGLLSLYSLGVFGYITALIASILVGRQTASPPPEEPDMQALRDDIAALRADIQGAQRSD